VAVAERTQTVPFGLFWPRYTGQNTRPERHPDPFSDSFRAKFATCDNCEYGISACVASVTIRTVVRRRGWTLGRGDQYRRVSPETPSPQGCDSAPCWPMAVIQECTFMEPEVCPWRILRTSQARRSGKFRDQEGSDVTS